MDIKGFKSIVSAIAEEAGKQVGATEYVIHQTGGTTQTGKISFGDDHIVVKHDNGTKSYFTPDSVNSINIRPHT